MAWCKTWVCLPACILSLFFSPALRLPQEEFTTGITPVGGYFGDAYSKFSTLSYRSLQFFPPWGRTAMVFVLRSLRMTWFLRSILILEDHSLTDLPTEAWISINTNKDRAILINKISKIGITAIQTIQRDNKVKPARAETFRLRHRPMILPTVMPR